MSTEDDPMRHLLIAAALLFALLASPLHAQDDKDAPKKTAEEKGKVHTECTLNAY